MPRKQYDAFISYASEDKASIASPLAVALRKLGLSVWFDDFELSVGDSLRDSIERGLASSRFGVVIFSPNFFRKKWPRRELNGLFSRELVSNRKRILPILHEISIRDLTKRFPIQSDRVSLSSADGIERLCTCLTDVIRPELRAPEVLRDRASELAESFIKAAQLRYPQYVFGISTTGASGGMTKVDIRLADTSPSSAKSEINVTFVGEGVRKASEFLKTGKSQTWKTGEFSSVTSSMPFFREITDGVLTVAPAGGESPRPVALRCGDGEFAYMQMRRIRGGTDEMELEISEPAEPLTVRLVWPLKSRRRKIDTSLSWKTVGFRPRQLDSLIKFLDGVAQGAPISILDLRRDLPEVSIPLIRGKPLPEVFDTGARNIVRTSLEVEQRFAVKMNVSFALTNEDLESLVIFDSLFWGSTVSGEISGSYKIRRGRNQAADDLILRTTSTLTYFAPVENFSGYLPLFGVRVKIPLWGVAAECRPQITDEERSAYESASPDTEFTFVVANTGRARYRWASEFPQSAPRRRRISSSA